MKSIIYARNAALCVLGTLYGLSSLAPSIAAAEDGADNQKWHKTYSLIGKSKYDEGFEHYDHVNPDAPKGGTLNSVTRGSYDSFNPFITRGSPVAGLNYQGGLLWDNLMAKGVDESSTSHGLIAEAFSFPDDYSSATYRLNPKAKWHDGKPITPEDIKWTMEVLKEHSPIFHQYFANVKEVRIDGDHEVTFIFDQKDNRELPLILGDLPVLPKHWWEGTDKDGEKRDISKPTLEAPLGSGPYKIKAFKPGASITWERVKDYWAQDLAPNKGRNNFDELKYVYFGDANAMWEAFKKGGLADIRTENRAQYWAERYNFPAFEDGEVKREEFKVTSSYPAQGFIFNTRLDKFKDRLVRKALTLVYNFEAMNEDLFFGLYSRTKSYFGGTELSATGALEGREKEILEEYRGKIPDEIFEEEISLPVYKKEEDERKYLKEAYGLLKQAGWKRKGSKLVDKNGNQFTLEILGYSSVSEKVNAPWIKALRKLGIDATFRVVDTSQFIQRTTNFDYDVVVAPTRQSMSPGNEQRDYWTTAAADKPGSKNYMGAKDPVIDELVERLIYAKDRAELVAVTRALDRLLLFQYYMVPQFHNAVEWVAYWDKFGIPRPQPSYLGTDTFSWWIDPEKEKALDSY